jgi:hypothetical protein
MLDTSSRANFKPTAEIDDLDALAKEVSKHLQASARRPTVRFLPEPPPCSSSRCQQTPTARRPLSSLRSSELLAANGYDLHDVEICLNTKSQVRARRLSPPLSGNPHDPRR